MKIATNILKDAVSKAVKGASNNSNMPLTGMIGIKLHKGEFRLLTTDLLNKLCVIVSNVDGDDVDITVSADIFSKLISKITSESVELFVENDTLNIKANGNYKIPLECDETGVVSFPDIKFSSGVDVVRGKTKLSYIMHVYNINKASLSKEVGTPLVGYMCTENSVISTNGSILTFNGLDLFNGQRLLISPQMMYLLTLSEQEDINFSISGNSIVFTTKNLILEGAELSGKEDYPVDDIAEYFNIEFASSCKLPRELLTDVLDRLMLFINSYDRNCAKFTFTRSGLLISSKAGSSDELVRYVGSDNFQEFSCEVHIPAFKQLVQASPVDTITLFYGNDSVLAIKDGVITQILSLGSDDEVEYDE